MISDLIKLADDLDRSGNAIFANKIDLLIKKIATYGDYDRCIECGKLFLMSRGSRNSDGAPLCPIHSGFQTLEEYQRSISEVNKPFPRTTKYKIYGDEF